MAELIHANIENMEANFISADEASKHTKDDLPSNLRYLRLLEQLDAKIADQAQRGNRKVSVCFDYPAAKDKEMLDRVKQFLISKGYQANIYHFGLDIDASDPHNEFREKSLPHSIIHVEW